MEEEELRESERNEVMQSSDSKGEIKGPAGPRGMNIALVLYIWLMYIYNLTDSDCTTYYRAYAMKTNITETDLSFDLNRFKSHLV